MFFSAQYDHLEGAHSFVALLEANLPRFAPLFEQFTYMVSIHWMYKLGCEAAMKVKGDDLLALSIWRFLEQICLVWRHFLNNLLEGKR